MDAINYPKRTSGVELPSAPELLDILAKESPRKSCKFDYLSIHANIFDAHNKLATLAGINDDWTREYASKSLVDLVMEITNTHHAIVRYIERTTNDDLYRQLYWALVPDDRLEKSDAIFVFGSKTNVRVERAVELYHAGIAPKIIVSGRAPHYGEDAVSEADRMAQFARESGVPTGAIVIEPSSITLPDNVKRTLDAMEQTAWRPSAMTIVATNFVLQRAMMEWYKFTPWDIQVHPVAARTKSPHFQADTWHQNPETIALVLNEYAKLVIESKIDLIRRDQNL